MSLDELRATGVPRPADAIYQLQLSGHRITRTAQGHELDEGPRQPPAPQEPPPRVRVTPRSDPS